jgi:hypothetical protein
VILSVSPEFSGFSVHIHTYLVQPKTGADPGIKLFRPSSSAPPAERVAKLDPARAHEGDVGGARGSAPARASASQAVAVAAPHTVRSAAS